MSDPISKKPSWSRWFQFDTLLPWLVLILSLCVTYQLWRGEQENAVKELRSKFEFRMHEIKTQIEQQILIYRQALTGVQSFFEASDHIQRQEFHDYVSKILHEKSHMGIRAMGYAQRMDAHGKSVHLKDARNRDHAEYPSIPQASGDTYAPLVYIEPFDDYNYQAFGHDAFAETSRRAAMEKARDLDVAVMTGRVDSLLGEAGDQYPGFLMYMPIYRNDVPHRNVAERQANIAGWVFSKLAADELISSVLRDKEDDLSIQVYDDREQSPNGRSLLFNNHAQGQLQPQLALFHTTTSIDTLGHHWSLVATTLPAFEAKVDYRRAKLIAHSGIYVSFLLGFLTYMMLLRTRAINSMRKINEKLSSSEQQLKFALEGAGDGVWDWDVRQDHMQYSPRWLEILGYDADELPLGIRGRRSLVHELDVSAVSAELHSYLERKLGTYINEHRVRCRDGSWKWVLDRGMVVSRDDMDQPLRMVGTLTDISHIKASEELIWKQANFDSLTGLPNRRMFYDRLEQDIKKVQRRSARLALLFLDLDRFKEVNDTLGHDQGDKLLVEAAQRLLSCVRDSDTVARLGGDEFIIILNDLEEGSVMPRIAQDVLYQLLQPFQLGDAAAYVSASLGLTLYPDDAQTVDGLMKNVDQAMYAAKHQGGNRYSYFTPAMQLNAQSRMQLANDLRLAVTNQEFHLVYQPIVDLSTGSISKAEALLRWKHPVRGMISPAEFIPIAEDTGIINEIGEWVFAEATRQAHEWRLHYHPEFQISINKSPVQFHNEQHASAEWFAHLQQLGMPGSGLVVEITEGLLLDASEHVVQRLLAFRDAGIQVSLDDFGTGYSSLSYLKKFDIDFIKIDMSFVANLAPDSDDLALCEAIIVMAHKLDMQVVAEGVETEQQRDLLVDAGCNYGQGYLFSRPLPALEFTQLISLQAA